MTVMTNIKLPWFRNWKRVFENSEAREKRHQSKAKSAPDEVSIKIEKKKESSCNEKTEKVKESAERESDNIFCECNGQDFCMLQIDRSDEVAI